MIDHIFSRLSEPLRLTELAQIAELSPFHFQRVFQAIIGETPSEFVKRIRLEYALRQMSYGRQKSLTEIALNCGFGSSSDFSRSFKQRYGVAPSKFDFSAWQADQGDRQEPCSSHWENSFRLKRNTTTVNPDKFRVKIRELPARRVAYIRVSNPYQGDRVVKAAIRLMNWVDRLGHAEGQWLGYQYEVPEITSLESCFYCVAVEIRAGIRPEGEIGIFQFPPLKVAEVSMSGDINLELRLLQWLYGNWLPRSNHLPASHPCFEAWKGRPFSNGYEHFELTIQLPIES